VSARRPFQTRVRVRAHARPPPTSSAYRGVGKPSAEDAGDFLGSRITRGELASRFRGNR